MKKYIVYIVLFIPIISFSQEVTGIVSGNDNEGKQALPGVNIYWQGTSDGVVSNNKGEFKIRKKDGQHMLVFSFVGYNSKVVHISNNKPLKVVLDPNLELGEVTVVKKDKGSYMSVINPIQTEKITGAELHKAACCNLAESFETNPSVDVSYSDAVSGAKQIKLLGLAGTYSKLQTENIPNLGGLATSYGLTYIPGPWMESMQVSKGTASVLNGYESITGQINVEFKKPDSVEKLHLNAFAGASGKKEFNGNTNLKLKSDTLTTGLLVHWEDLSKENDDNKDGFLDEPLIKQFHVLNRWKFNNQKGYMAQTGVNLLVEDRTGGQTGFDKNLPRNANTLYGVNINTTRIEAFFKNGYVFPNQRVAIAFLSNYYYHEQKSFFGLNDFDANESKFFSNLILTIDLDKHALHTLNTGASYVFNKFNEKLVARDQDYLNLRKESVSGLFAEYTYKPNHKFSFMTGIRTDFHNLFGTIVTPRMHFRYSPVEQLAFRASAGKGYRSANILAENMFLLNSSRKLSWEEDIYLENAWNYGASLVQTYNLFDRPLQINTEFYRTDFLEQIIVDRETSSSEILLNPLDGKSYANSFQVDLKYEVLKRLDLTLAYRSNDVKQTINGVLKEKPLTSRFKGLVSLNYTTNLKKWMFDFTTQFNGGGRIARFNVPANATTDYYEFSPYKIINAQVTKYFRYWSIYAGAENLTDFKQKNPISGADNPFGPNFDSTNIWGPVMGRRIYVGVRFTLNYE